MGLKTLGGNRQHAFSLGFPMEILHVRPLIVGVNDPDADVRVRWSRTRDRRSSRESKNLKCRSPI